MKYQTKRGAAAIGCSAVKNDISDGRGGAGKDTTPTLNVIRMNRWTRRGYSLLATLVVMTTPLPPPPAAAVTMAIPAAEATAAAAAAVGGALPSIPI